jgi:hypothetical protein
MVDEIFGFQGIADFYPLEANGQTLAEPQTGPRYSLLLAQLVREKTGEPEGKAYLGQVRSLAQAQSPTAFAQGLLGLGRDQERRGNFTRASLCYSTLIKEFPRSPAAVEAQERLRVFSGQGTPLQHAVWVGGQIKDQLFDPGLFLGILAGAGTFRAVSGGVLKLLGTRTLSSRALAYGLGSLTEVPAFTLTMKGVHELAVAQDWSAEALRHDLIHNGITVFALKGFGGLGYTSLKGLPHLKLPALLHKVAEKTVPSLAMFGGIHSAHGAAVALDWEAPTPTANSLIQSLATVLHFQFVGKLLQPYMPTHTPVGLPRGPHDLGPASVNTPAAWTQTLQRWLNKVPGINVRTMAASNGLMGPTVAMAKQGPSDLGGGPPGVVASNGASGTRPPQGENGDIVLTVLRDVAKSAASTAKRKFTPSASWSADALGWNRRLEMIISAAVTARGSKTGDTSLITLIPLRSELGRISTLLEYLSKRQAIDPSIGQRQSAYTDLLSEHALKLELAIQITPWNVPFFAESFLREYAAAAESTHAFLSAPDGPGRPIENWLMARGRLQRAALEMRREKVEKILELVDLQPPPLDLSSTWRQESYAIGGRIGGLFHALPQGDAVKISSILGAARDWQNLLEGIRHDVRSDTLREHNFGEAFGDAVREANWLTGLLRERAAPQAPPIPRETLLEITRHLYLGPNALSNFFNHAGASKPKTILRDDLTHVVFQTFNASRILLEKPVMEHPEATQLDQVLARINEQGELPKVTK